jgi:sortase A
MPLMSTRRSRSILLLARWFFLALGVALLGVVGYALLDAKLYQERENKRLNQAMKPSAEASAGVPMQVLPVRLSATAEVQHVKVASGSAIGRIEISRIGIDVIIAEGTDGKTLRHGVGHLKGTALPGEPGNVAIAGHRDTFFRALRNVRQDDEITLTTLDGSYHYRVDWTKVVGDDATEVLSDSDEATLTLVTCYPFYFVGPAPSRFIVRAHKL